VNSIKYKTNLSELGLCLVRLESKFQLSFLWKQSCAAENWLSFNLLFYWNVEPAKMSRVQNHKINLPEITVYYGSCWGHAPRFAELRNMICKSIRNEIVVRGIQKGRTEFEVFINGQLAFSKLKEGHFPDLDLILEEIDNAANDSDYKINYITETESFCTCRYTSCCQIS